MSETTRIRIRELFAAAAELPAAERLRFLERECGDDARVREQVASLLSALERAGTFLADAPVETASVPPQAVASDQASSAAGSAIGPYKLLQLLGEGGFGEVWMAQQESPVRRRVALKILKLGMDSRRVIARFEQERQALALMDHPNIARVFDAGTSETGRPYFVMELVRGVAVTQFCDEHKLTVDQRLRLFRDVCDAVQHAHSKGVIHRDLKPSNVLVAMGDSGGGTPLAKVIDFGIAKAISEPLTDRTLFTELHAMIGTPAYMAPEQAEMNAVDIDTRSDIYSLGVLLYEMLSGSTPLDASRLRSAGLPEIQRLIRDEPAARPSQRIATLQREASRGSSESAARLDSVTVARRMTPATLQRRLAGELDWIVLKAIEKDRNRRYATASALARDVQRFLDREPVEAGPVSVWYRARKFAQRNRAAVVAVVAILLILIIATGVSVLAWLRAMEREREAVNARRFAEAAQAEAVRERDEARRAREGEALQRRQAELQERASRQVTDFTTDLLALADPRFSQRPDATVHDLLELASQKVEQQFADNPLAEARIRSTIGKAYLGLLKFDAAVPPLSRAIEILEAAGAPDEHELYELHMARSWAAASADVQSGAMASASWLALFQRVAGVDRELGDLLQKMQRGIEREYGRPGFPETRALLDRLMARASVVLPRGHPDRAFLAYWLFTTADRILGLAQDEFSIALAEQALRIYAEEYGQEDAQTLTYQWWLIFLHTNFEHWDAAERLIEECADRAQRVLGGDHPAVRALERERAECAAARGDPAAIPRMQDLLAGFEQQSSRYNLFTLFTMVRLSRALERAGRGEEADAQRRRLAKIILAHDSRCDQFTIEHLWTGRTFWEAVRFAVGSQGRDLPRDQCNAGFLEIVDRLADAVPTELAPDDPRRAILARMLTDLADYMEELPYIEAETVARTADLALELAEPFEDRAPFVVSRALTLIAWHRNRHPESGDLRVGEQQLRRAVELRRRQERLDPWWAAHAESMLAEFLLLQGRPAEAEQMLASAYATIFHARGPEDGNARGTLRRMLKACHESGPSPAARQSSGYVRALAQLLFAVALGAEEAAGDAELLDLDRRLMTLTDDAAAMQEVLTARRGRVTPQHDDLDRIVMLVQHWTQDYVAAGGSYAVGCALADDFLELIRAAPQAHAAAQRRLCWLGATICTVAGDASRGERYAREGLNVAGGETGLWHALLESVLGRCLFQQGELAAARPLVVSAFESILVLQGAGHGDTGVALRRVVEVLEALGDMNGAANLAAQRLRQLTEFPLNAEDLNDSAWWIVRRTGRSAELYELGLRAAETSTRFGPTIAARQNTLGVAQYRVGRFADAVATLTRSDELQTAGGGSPQVADWAFLAMAHAQLGQFEQARRCLDRAEEIAGSAVRLADEDAAFLAEARTMLATR